MKGKTFAYFSVALFLAFMAGFFIGAKIEHGQAGIRADFSQLQYAQEISDMRVRLDDALTSAQLYRQMVTFTGVASWYGDREHGRITANNERFSKFAMTAASKLFPFNTRWRVRNLENGQEIIVRINDDGPNVRGRVIDLSQAAARLIGLETPGTARVLLTPALGE